MHKIYIENRCIAVCSQDEKSLSDPNSIELHLGDRSDIDTFVRLFESSSALQRIYIPTDDVESTYKAFCQQFREVNAAGGLVSNRRGDVLLIRRNGLWDLPKGHQEKGEAIDVTAIREVQEETGLGDIVLNDLICITDHCYIRDGRWHLKHTWWYSMLYTSPVELIPQQEEDITKAAWISKGTLPACLKETYPSIAEVFRNLK